MNSLRQGLIFFSSVFAQRVLRCVVVPGQCPYTSLMQTGSRMAMEVNVNSSNREEWFDAKHWDCIKCTSQKKEVENLG